MKQVKKKRITKLAETSRLAGSNNFLQGRIGSIQQQIISLTYAEPFKDLRYVQSELNALFYKLGVLARIADERTKEKIEQARNKNANNNSPKDSTTDSNVAVPDRIDLP